MPVLEFGDYVRPRVSLAAAESFDSNNTRQGMCKNEAATTSVADTLASLKVADGSHDADDVFTPAEREAFACVKAQLLADGVPPSELSEREIGLITMIEKLRVSRAVAKYKEFMAELAKYNLSIATLHSDPTEPLDRFWSNYRVCGRDKGGRSIMFICGNGIRVEDEDLSVRAGILWYLAVHSDVASLRDGITFIIDSSANAKPIGNESKLQKTWSALPLRPKHFYIVGASALKRLFVNALLKLAALFTSVKVIKRIRFCDVEEVLTAVQRDQLPACFGGQDHGSEREWVMARLRTSQGWFVSRV